MNIKKNVHEMSFLKVLVVETIMTTEPKFIPNEAVDITVGANLNLKVRLVDCVGYLVNNAIGYLEDDMPRMVKKHLGLKMKFLLKNQLKLELVK